MKSMSIRGANDQLVSLLKDRAAASNKSVNQLVLEVLQKFVGLDKKKTFTAEYHDLDHLFGKWSEDDYLSIQEKIDCERKIDQELWK
ncbi:MAG: antitoxin [Desulfobacteraceae bacterium 4572_35.2]|nr:MAG: antitoxin [Desulfobacteraceae bacterium 4572_35.2]